MDNTYQKSLGVAAKVLAALAEETEKSGGVDTNIFKVGLALLGIPDEAIAALVDFFLEENLIEEVDGKYRVTAAVLAEAKALKRIQTTIKHGYGRCGKHTFKLLAHQHEDGQWHVMGKVEGLDIEFEGLDTDMDTAASKMCKDITSYLYPGAEILSETQVKFDAPDETVEASAPTNDIPQSRF